MSTLTTNPKSESTESQSDVETESRTQAYIELTKLRISVMVLLTFAVAAVLAAQQAGTWIGFGTFVGAIIGMLAVAASGNAMNMYLERYSDFLMPRTANRPLPAQKLSATEVAMFGAVTLGIGIGFLLALVNWQTAVCGVANWILYVFIYTPLKRKTSLNTEIGAIAGAMPIIMGCLAATETVDLLGWAFFGVLVFWQFPHFMAIAWKYRDQYEAGGLKMLTVTEPTGKAAGVKSIVTGVLLIAVSLLPILVMRTVVHSWIFGFVALGLGIFYLMPAIKFYRERNNETARTLLRASLLYLPLYMMAMLVACLT